MTQAMAMPASTSSDSTSGPRPHGLHSQPEDLLEIAVQTLDGVV